jgi:hypothetical protein
MTDPSILRRVTEQAFKDKELASIDDVVAASLPEIASVLAIYTRDKQIASAMRLDMSAIGGLAINS